MPVVCVIGGPNGAGKTTLAYQLLPESLCRQFVNADEIAAGLSPFAHETVRVQAGRLMLRRMRELACRGEDFAFESTLSSRSPVKFLRGLRGKNYRIHLIYIYLHSVNLALARVRNRVRCGGHDIPVADIKRRYHRSLANLKNDYLPLAGRWTVYDNSTDNLRVVAHGGQAAPAVEDETQWRQINR